MYSDSTDEQDIPHFAYLVLRVFPPFPPKIAVLCHHAETKDIFLPSGRVRSSPITKVDKVEVFILESVVLQIGYRIPSD
jgi:hypothetical protein